MASSRPRRFFYFLLSLPVLFLLVLYLVAPVSHRTISHLFRSTGPHASKLPDEIFGLLHFVTSPDEAGRVFHTAGDGDVPLQNLGGPVDPEKPVALAWYALGSIAQASERTAHGRGQSGSTSSDGRWEDRLRVLREEYPLVVFSKSYCPYSKRAKKLLETYDLSPPPKIVEVDLRVDSPHIKTLLTRLTHRSTFPNVILHGRSIGGSDDLIRLHEEDRLREVLEAAGMMVRWAEEGGEGIFL